MSVLLRMLDTYVRVAAQGRRGGRAMTERAGCRKNYCCQACEEPVLEGELRTKVYFANTDHPLVFRLCAVCVEVGGVTVTWTHAHPDPQ
jgi:hypothetical protein